MSCENCTKYFPGAVISVKTIKDRIYCSECGDEIMSYDECIHSTRNWDIYFHKICESVASKSPCLSRKIGAILVKDNIVVATGYNGPARGIPHCGHDRFMKDSVLSDIMHTLKTDFASRIATTCPRQILGYQPGTHMELCPAEHAERNCIASAARVGVSVKGTTLYMNCVIPCKNCLNLLINAGVSGIVVDNKIPYDKYSDFILKHSTIKIREFDL